MRRRSRFCKEGGGWKEAAVKHKYGTNHLLSNHHSVQQTPFCKACTKLYSMHHSVQRALFCTAYTNLYSMRHFLQHAPICTTGTIPCSIHCKHTHSCKHVNIHCKHTKTQLHRDSSLHFTPPPHHLAIIRIQPPLFNSHT